MEKKQKIYIAREYVLTDDYGGVRIDEESVFTSFEEARNFVNTLGDKEATGDYLLSFRIEILEHEMGRTESFLKRWAYNVKGELLDTYDDLIYTPDPDYLKYSGKYKVGDFVYIVPNIHHKLSPSIKGTYGVVVEVSSEPNVYYIFDGGGEEIAEELLREYTIYYIAEDGLLDHWHIVESALRMP